MRKKVSLKGALHAYDHKVMKDISFEEALKNLEQSVERLESGELPLEKALEVFETGIHMSRICSRKLEEAEKKVELLLGVSNGEAQTSLFDVSQIQE